MKKKLKKFGGRVKAKSHSFRPRSAPSLPPEPFLANPPSAMPPLPANEAAAIPIPIGGAVPASIPIQRPNIPLEFPADLSAALHDAKTSGRWMIAVFEADEAGTIKLFRHTSGGFAFDWWLRALSMFRDQVVNAEPPGAKNEINPAAAE